ASEEGVSRLHEDGGVLTITNFSALDGLPVQNGRVLPVRDVAVDQDGTAWLATDGGLWRVVLPGGVVEGVVRDPTGQAIAEVDVIVPGTPYRAATDAAGRFVLAHLPTGRQRVQFDGRIAAGDRSRLSSVRSRLQGGSSNWNQWC
ncbi:MAG TPA: carboxypeptidase-like regulatory domain-containing protein, partial [Candidatus Tectomicrobia bacterium]